MGLKSHSKNLQIKLPPKKLRPSSEFLSKRLSELDNYMKQIVEFYGEMFPIKLTDFLHFFKFEPHGLVYQLHQCIKEVTNSINPELLQIIYIGNNGLTTRCGAYKTETTY